jgi:predicted tellurium resistance membrane protein TerC
MRRRLLPAGLLLLILGYFGPLFAQDGAAPPAAGGIDVRLQPRDGPAVSGRLLTPHFRLKTDFGFEEIEARHIRSIQFRAPTAAEGQDTIELADRSVFHGHLEEKELAIETTDGPKTFTTSSLREVRAERKKEFNLWGIVLGLITLTAMEIVLGIDNVIFLAIVAAKLPEKQQPRARRLGLAVALGTRLLLLFSLTFLMSLTRPLFTLPEMPLFHQMDAREISMRDLVLFVGGLFLIYKSTTEIHEKLEAEDHEASLAPRPTTSFAKVIVQIALIDIIFSLDSVITAIGMVEELWVMVTAMVLAMFVMLAFAGIISDFVAKHPTLKMLALSFLILIGVMLVAQALGQHIDKGYIYFAMAFGVGVEFLNLKLRKKHAAAKEEKK